VNFDSTGDGETFKCFTHDDAQQYASAAAEKMGVEQTQPDDFDKETAEKWLALDKKKRKVLAKNEHPAKALKNEAAREAKKKQKESAAVSADEAKG
jgi:hypothetical protein